MKRKRKDEDNNQDSNSRKSQKLYEGDQDLFEFIRKGNIKNVNPAYKVSGGR